MPLYAERVRRQGIEAAEAEGDSFWTRELDEKARYKLEAATKEVIAVLHERNRDIREQISLTVCKNVGLPSDRWATSAPMTTFFRPAEAIVDEDTPIAVSIIEATLNFAADSRFGGNANIAEYYERKVDDVLKTHRLEFALIDREFVPLGSEALHAEIVEPVVRLLRNRDGWEAVEKAYTDALGELYDGKPEDAVTDAASALQEALGSLGASGNTVSKRFKDLADKGVLQPYDKHMASWLEADRAEKGDVHDAAPSEGADAWLVVHIVGAWIRRLSELDDAARA